jgi:hypothetical protein
MRSLQDLETPAVVVDLDVLEANLAIMNMGLFPQKLVMIGLVWGLVEYILAAIAGAWVYKEA